eukprot:9270507-Alexandrium_andersonii.AAC.1
MSLATESVEPGQRFGRLKRLLLRRRAPLRERFSLLDKAVRPVPLWASEVKRPSVTRLREVRKIFRQMLRLIQPMGKK